jgi:hypothetical protein
MMSLEALELCDHHLAGRDQYVTVLIGKGARQESLGKARIASGFVVRIARSGGYQTVNHFAGLLDAIGWDAAPMSVAEKEAGCLCKLSRICSPRSSSSQQEDQGGCNSYSWTHGKLQSNTSSTRVTPEGPVRFGSFAALPACHFLDIHPDLAGSHGNNGGDHRMAKHGESPLFVREIFSIPGGQ